MSKRQVPPADRETARGIMIRLSKQLGDIRKKNRRTRQLVDRGPRTFRDMVDDGTVRTFPETASLSRPRRPV